MKKTVPAEQAVTKHEHPLSARVQEALGELVGVAREGLLALSVGVGLGVLAELMAEEVTEVVGPKGRHDAGRQAVRRGHEADEDQIERTPRAPRTMAPEQQVRMHPRDVAVIRFDVDHRQQPGNP